jgi:hypothetical protein
MVAGGRCEIFSWLTPPLFFVNIADKGLKQAWLSSGLAVRWPFTSPDQRDSNRVSKRLRAVSCLLRLQDKQYGMSASEHSQD